MFDFSLLLLGFFLLRVIISHVLGMNEHFGTFLGHCHASAGETFQQYRVNNQVCGLCCACRKLRMRAFLSLLDARMDRVFYRIPVRFIISFRKRLENPASILTERSAARIFT